MQKILPNKNPKQGLLGNTNSSLFGSNLFQKGQRSIRKELIEEEKAQFRSVAVPEPRYCDRLKQEIKKNKMLKMHLTMDNYPIDNLRDGRKLARKMYRVQRRKNIVKDDYCARINFASGLGDRDVAKSFSVGVKYFRELEIKLEQNSYYRIMKNWIRIFQSKRFPKIKTLNLKMASWYILEAFPHGFSRLKSLFQDVENLNVTFTQMHGKKDLLIQDFTLRFIRRLDKLKNLRIEFTYCQFIKDEHLDVISRTLRSRLNSLESLKLVLDGLNDQVTPKAIERLWKSVNKIPSLKTLDLIGGFGQNKINYGAFAELCDVIERKSATLLSLKVDIGYTEIRSPAHQQLCKVLVPLLPILHRLELKFVCLESVSDQSLILFGDLLSNGSNSLKTLGLQFGTHHGLTTRGAKELANRIKKGCFPMVEKLSIDFQMTYDLTYYGLYDIAEAVSIAFPNLKDFWFSYSGSHASIDAKITKKANSMLKDRLKSLPKEFRLYW